MTDFTEIMRARRETLRTMPAPQPRHDTIVMLSASLGSATLRLRYVPDRDVLSPQSLTSYLAVLARQLPDSLEETAQTVLEDVNDQVIPCWLEVTLSQSTGDIAHQVRIEDRQPRWQDRGLLDRLAP